MHIPADVLERAVAAAFRAAGATPRNAGLIARHLVEASLTGHDSHGVGLMPHYLEGAAAGDLNLNQELTVLRDDGSILLFEGGRGAGQVMAHDATVRGIERAKARGLALVGLRDSYHIGRVGHWAEQCCAAGLVSIHFVNVPGHAAVAPFGGLAARLGTNPFTAGFPRPGDEPIVVDFATSRWALGKVRVAHATGKTAPPGTLLDAAGAPTIDPAVMFNDPSGALLPFGEHKGFGLGLACEILAGALLGGLTQEGKPLPISNGLLSVILSPAAFGGADAYAARLEALVAWVRSAGHAVRLPGEPERARRAALLADGIEIDAVTWDKMRDAAAKLGIADLVAAGREA